jgi:hypothetical protein
MHRPEFEKLLTATVPSSLMLCEEYVCFVLSLQDLDRQNQCPIAIHLAETGGSAEFACADPYAWR